MEWGKKEELQAELAMGLLNGSGRKIILDIGAIQIQFGARRIQPAHPPLRRLPLLQMEAAGSVCGACIFSPFYFDGVSRIAGGGLDYPLFIHSRNPAYAH